MGGKPVFYKIFSRIAVICGIIAFPGTKSAVAQSKDLQAWEFSGDRQPNFDLPAILSNKFIAMECHEQLNVLYDNYVAANPDYRTLANDPAMRKNWCQALVHHGIDNKLDTFNFCTYFLLSNTIKASPLSNEKSRHIFCGLYGSFLREFELHIADSLQELAGYALYGSISANYYFLGITDTYAAITLNDDVRYFFQELIWEQTADYPEIRKAVEDLVLSKGDENLSFERRKFIESAIRRQDYNSVQETTDPC